MTSRPPSPIARSSTRPIIRPITPEQAHDIAVDAYVYLYPLVLMDITRRQMTHAVGPHPSGTGPMSAFSHARAYPAAGFKGVVRPNFDTLYSIVWLDLTSEPAIIDLPPTPDRYLILPMMDMWSDVFAAPGSRTTGEEGGRFAVVPPGWTGSLPSDARRIEAPTPYVWIIGRTQTNGPADYPAVHAIQDAMVTRPLSKWSDPSWQPVGHDDPAIDMETPPLRQVNAMPAETFFTMAAELLQLHPVHATDWSIVARMAAIGIVPGSPFDPAHLDPAVRDALASVPDAARKMMGSRGMAGTTVSNGWRLITDTMGVYGNYYTRRAVVAMVGLGALPPEDAVYPLLLSDADGDPLIGTHRYRIHFEPGALPPADAFWSITIYDAEGFHVDNPLDRFALGDRDPLRYGSDGSLDIHIQSGIPDAEEQPNWLPAPPGPLSVTLRIYAPGTALTQGSWVPPAVQRIR